MAFKIFLDANVCLDFLLRRDYYSQTRLIVEKILTGELKAFVSPAIVHIVAFYLAKYYEKHLIKSIIIDWLANVKVIDCTHDIAIHAINSHMTDIEDALQYYTAIHHKLNYFISLDKNLVKSAIPVLPVYFPYDFVKKLND